MALDRAARVELLRRARRAIARAVGAPPPTPHTAPGPDPDHRAGAFVTIRLRGELRGCIGCPDPELPLAEVVEQCAASAAISDPRFAPLSMTELHEVALEISVLGAIEPVDDLSQVVVGQHGLIVAFGRRRGLLLPQVAIEWGWTAAELAAQACAKAGLPPDAWQKGAKLFRFEAEVFGED